VLNEIANEVINIRGYINVSAVNEKNETEARRYVL